MVRVAYLTYRGVHVGHLLWIYVLRRDAEVNVIHTDRGIFSNAIRGSYDIGISEGLKPLPLALLFKKLHLIDNLYLIAMSPAIFTHKFLMACKHVDGIIAVSSLVKSAIEESGYDGPIHVVNPCPPDLDRFLCVKPVLSKPNICFIGTPISAKGFDRLSLLIDQVMEAIPQARLILIGGELNMEGVTSLGWTTREKIRETLSECSVCVYPARFEASGTSVLEAMAAGIIPVVTPTTGMAEVVAKVDPSLVVNFSEMPRKVIELLRSDMSLLSKKCKEVTKNLRTEVIRQIDSFLSKACTGC